MKNRILLFFFFIGLICLPVCVTSQTTVRGVVTPEEYGAKGNGTHDDTRAIQQAIDQLVKIGGGTVKLGSGIYLVRSIKLGPKVVSTQLLIRHSNI